MSNKADFIEAETFLVKHPEIEAIDLLVPDVNGVLRGKRIRPDALSKAYQEGVCLPGSLFGTDITGATVEATGLGFDEGDADRICWPLSGMLKPAPWFESPLAQVLMSMSELDNRPFFGDPRHILAGVLERFSPLKLTLVTAVEMEFYLIDQRRDSNGAPQPPLSPATGDREHKTQVYGISELEDYGAFLSDIASAATLQDLPAETAVAEYAPGQYEINLRHVANPLLACDHAVMLKRLIKGVALKHGMEATFMAKPYDELSGSGMHIHISLLDEAGSNVFQAADPTTNKTLRCAVGGLVETMADAMALFAPNGNSFRRFQVDSYVPLSPNWGLNNRTTALRIPSGPGHATRVEHRVAGADANPYLLMAVLLAGIHQGITRRIEPPAPVTGNAYQQYPPSLPTDWRDALDLLRESAFAADYLGGDFIRIYVANKLHERASFNRKVTALEYEWYLRTV